MKVHQEHPLQSERNPSHRSSACSRTKKITLLNFPKAPKTYLKTHNTLELSSRLRKVLQLSRIKLISILPLTYEQYLEYERIQDLGPSESMISLNSSYSGGTKSNKRNKYEQMYQLDKERRKVQLKILSQMLENQGNHFGSSRSRNKEYHPSHKTVSASSVRKKVNTNQSEDRIHKKSKSKKHENQVAVEYEIFQSTPKFQKANGYKPLSRSSEHSRKTYTSSLSSHKQKYLGKHCFSKNSLYTSRAQLPPDPSRRQSSLSSSNHSNRLKHPFEGPVNSVGIRKTKLQNAYTVKFPLSPSAQSPCIVQNDHQIKGKPYFDEYYCQKNNTPENKNCLQRLVKKDCQMKQKKQNKKVIYSEKSSPKLFQLNCDPRSHNANSMQYGTQQQPIYPNGSSDSPSNQNFNSNTTVKIKARKEDTHEQDLRRKQAQIPKLNQKQMCGLLAQELKKYDKMSQKHSKELSKVDMMDRQSRKILRQAHSREKQQRERKIKSLKKRIDTLNSNKSAK